jgi:hypothetical protein
MYGGYFVYALMQFPPIFIKILRGLCLRGQIGQTSLLSYVKRLSCLLGDLHLQRNLQLRLLRVVLGGDKEESSMGDLFAA